MNCPRCETATLDEREREGVTIDVCTSCRGLWLDRGELEKLVNRTKGEIEQVERSASEYARERRPERDSQPDYDDYRRKHPRKKSWMESLGDIFDRASEARGSGACKLASARALIGVHRTRTRAGAMHAPSREREEDAMHTSRNAQRACLRIGALLLILFALGCPITDPEPIGGGGGHSGVGGMSGAGGSGAGGVSGTTATGGVSGFVGDTGGGPSIGTEDGSSGITGRAGVGASGSS